MLNTPMEWEKADLNPGHPDIDIISGTVNAFLTAYYIYMAHDDGYEMLDMGDAGVCVATDIFLNVTELDN